MSCLRSAQCCSDGDVTSLYIPARRSADGWLRSKFFKTSSREKVCAIALIFVLPLAGSDELMIRGEKLF